MAASHLEKMRAMRSEPNAIGLLFVQTLRQTKARPMLVVEGDHDPLFIQTIACRYFDEFEFFIAHGNKSVLGIYAYVKRYLAGTAEFLKKKILFFLDKDHTEHFGKVVPDDDRIYVTDYYSIENHIACKEVLQDICKVCYGLNVLDDLYAEIMRKFDTFCDDLFAEAISPMILSICARQKGCQVVYDKIKIKNVFCVNADLELAVKCDPTEHFREKLGIPEDVVSRDDLIKSIEVLGVGEPRTILRGHFQMEIYVRFLENIRLFAANRKVKLKSKGIRAEDIFGLSTKGRPASLDEFLRLAATE